MLSGRDRGIQILNRAHASLSGFLAAMRESARFLEYMINAGSVDLRKSYSRVNWGTVSIISKATKISSITVCIFWTTVIRLSCQCVALCDRHNVVTRGHCQTNIKEYNAHLQYEALMLTHYRVLHVDSPNVHDSSIYTGLWKVYISECSPAVRAHDAGSVLGL